MFVHITVWVDVRRLVNFIVDRKDGIYAVPESRSPELGVRNDHIRGVRNHVREPEFHDQCCDEQNARGIGFPSVALPVAVWKIIR